MTLEHGKACFAQLSQRAIDMHGSQCQRVSDICLSHRYKATVVIGGPGCTQAHKAFAKQMRQSVGSRFAGRR